MRKSQHLTVLSSQPARSREWSKSRVRTPTRVEMGVAGPPARQPQGADLAVVAAGHKEPELLVQLDHVDEIRVLPENLSRCRPM